MRDEMSLHRCHAHEAFPAHAANRKYLRRALPVSAVRRRLEDVRQSLAVLDEAVADLVVGGHDRLGREGVVVVIAIARRRSQLLKLESARKSWLKKKRLVVASAVLAHVQIRAASAGSGRARSRRPVDLLKGKKKKEDEE